TPGNWWAVEIEQMMAGEIPAAETGVVLTLKRTGKHFNQPWGADDYVVLDNSRVIGQIMRHPQTPEGRPWFWTITAREMPPSVHNHGYSATREQAMADFKARWLHE